MKYEATTKCRCFEESNNRVQFLLDLVMFMYMCQTIEYVLCAEEVAGRSSSQLQVWKKRRMKHRCGLRPCLRDACEDERNDRS